KMVVHDIQFMNVLKGKRVKLTLKTSSYLGVVQRINPNKTLILHLLPAGHKHFVVVIDVISCILRQLLVAVMAVMHIKKQSVISVGADGVEIYQHGRLCWLQIATKNKVYLFDILLLGARAFKNGLSMILENKHILKVIHDCRAISGCLIAQFGVKLTNVFDIQVADAMCFYSETGGFLPDRVSTLQEVVSHHLKLYLYVLESMCVFLQEEKEMWYKRPCPVTLLKVMALSVIHLQPLRLVLLDALMTDYMALVDSYLNSSHYEPDELEHSVLELPRELRQLQQMHHERQEWAANHYPVTQHGLLARFNPRAKSPSQTSLTAEEDNQKQTDSFGPVNVKSPSSAQLEPLLAAEVTRVSSVDVHASPVPPAQAPVTASMSDFGKQINPLSVGVGRGCTELLIDTLGRGRSLGKDQSSLHSLPAIGRGFFLQVPPAHNPRESTGVKKSPGRAEMTPSSPSFTPSQNVNPLPGTSATDLPNVTSGLRGDLSSPTPQSLTSSLRQSFRSFRY
uniref:Exonuclease 3'-5' domain containing 1 n=1 Tax=Seriola lalandi dorsalis TaxID=1841481 RepID=A0A3B4YZG4_SERLL